MVIQINTPNMLSMEHLYSLSNSKMIYKHEDIYSIGVRSVSKPIPSYFAVGLSDYSIWTCKNPNCPI